MKKRSPRKSISIGQQAAFQWQVRDDSSHDEVEMLTKLPIRRGRRWGGIVAVVIVVGLMGYWGGDYLLRQAEEELGLVEELPTPEVVAEVDLNVVGEKGFRPPNLTAINAQIGDEWGKNVHLLELYGDMALVHMVIDQPSEPWYEEPYQVARILQQDGKGWQLIEPPIVFWNARRTLESDYFEIQHATRDASALEEIIGDLESFYVQLHQDLALPLPIRGERTQINITVIPGSHVRVTDLTYSGSTIIIPPPELIPRPLEISNAETLRQTISYALAVKLFEARQEQFSTACEWSAVAEGIGLWLRWEEHTLPSRRHWIYQSVLSEWSKPSSPPRLDDLLAFPLSCTHSPTMLEVEIVNSGRPVPRPEIASTLIDYIVTTYGRQVIPVLLHHMNEFSGWDSLAESSVQVTAAELEEGWQKFLMSRIQ